jgi:hypothetical protein
MQRAAYSKLRISTSPIDHTQWYLGCMYLASRRREDWMHPGGLVLMDMTTAVTTMTYLKVSRPGQISIRGCLAIHGLSLCRRCEIIAG